MAETSIRPRQVDLIRSILCPFAERIERAAIFGSHATGRARANSDIDLVLYGSLSTGDVDRLWTIFHESALSVAVDVVAYNEALYPPLKRHIDAVAKTLFTREQLKDAP